MDPYIDRNRFIGIKKKMMDNDSKYDSGRPSKLNYNRKKVQNYFRKIKCFTYDGFNFSMNLDQIATI